MELRPGQAEGTFQVADVTQLQRRMHTVGRVLERYVQPFPPARSAPFGQRRAQAADRHKLSGDGTGNPRIGLVEGWRRRDQVEDGIFGCCPRQLEWPDDLRFALVRSMDDD